MIPRQSINFPESLPKAVVLKYCKLSYTEETLVDSFLTPSNVPRSQKRVGLNEV